MVPDTDVLAGGSVCFMLGPIRLRDWELEVWPKVGQRPRTSNLADMVHLKRIPRQIEVHLHDCICYDFGI